MAKKINIDLTYNELEALTELVACGNIIINHEDRKKPLKKHDDLANRVVETWKAKILELEPERAAELEDLDECLTDSCNEFITEFEDASFPELLAWKLTNIKGDVPTIRDFIIKSKIFDEK